MEDHRAIRPKRGGSKMKHRIVTAAQMKAIEQAGNAHGLPYLQMIEQTKEVLL